MQALQSCFRSARLYTSAVINRAGPNERAAFIGQYATKQLFIWGGRTLFTASLFAAPYLPWARGVTYAASAALWYCCLTKNPSIACAKRAWDAIESGDSALAIEEIAKGADLTYRDPESRDDLFSLAAKCGQRETLRYLIEIGFDPRTSDSLQQAPDLETLRFLVEELGVSVQGESEKHYSPLFDHALTLVECAKKADSSDSIKKFKTECQIVAYLLQQGARFGGAIPIDEESDRIPNGTHLGAIRPIIHDLQERGLLANWEQLEYTTIKHYVTRKQAESEPRLH